MPPAALNCCVAPTSTVAVAGVTVSVVGGGATTAALIVMVPLNPITPLASCAVTIAIPALSPVSKPFWSIIAATELEFHPYGGVPPLAVNCCVAPALTVAVFGDTVMPAGGVTTTGALMTMVADDPRTPFASTAVTTVLPALTPVNKPFAAIDAAVESVLQV